MRRLTQAALAILLVAIVLSGPAQAAPSAVVVGDGTSGSCTETAFNAALIAGNAITFNCGGPKTIPFTTAKVISGPMNIDGGNIIALSGNLSTRLFTVNDSGMLSLHHITLEKGSSGAANGGAILSSGWLALDGVLIQTSQTDVNHRGGAIYATGPISIKNSTLSNNQAGGGGAIYALSSGAQIQMVDTDIDLNKALDPVNGAGGGIWLGPDSGLGVTGSQFVQNSAQVAGGAVALSTNAWATFLPHNVTGTFFMGNFANDLGGAILNETGVVAVRGADFEYNKTLTNTLATGYGGAIAAEGRLDVVEARFANNQGRFGGAVFAGGTLTGTVAGITRTVFFANTAGNLGGGLYTNVDTTTVTINGSSFEYNHAASGGGLARTNAHLSISQSSFTNNLAANGGGLLLQSLPNPDTTGYVEMRDSTISDNLATSTHSGGLANAGLLDLRNVTITNNHYGLYTINGAISRLQASVLDDPGGLNCDGDGTLPQSGGRNYVTDNSCQLGGFQDTEGTGLDAMLGPLVSGDPNITWYRIPLPNSPLINHGGPGCSSTDQRGALRPDACDIGAIEFGGLLPRLWLPLIRR